MPTLRAYLQVRGFHPNRDGQRRHLRSDVDVGVHVVELTTGVLILDAQPVLALVRDNLEFLIVRNIESLGPACVDARPLEIPLRKQVHLGRRATCQNTKKREKQGKLDMHGPTQS